MYEYDVLNQKLGESRNLKPRGKDSKSSPFVTICLGKEKFATSVIEKSQNPEWNEDCELIVRPRDSKLELTVLHQDFFLERFLGKVEIPLMEVEAAPKRSIRGWYKLLGKGNKTKKEDKNRGEIEITAQMKGDSNRSILPTAINVKSFARLDVHPLRKAASTPYIASHDDTSTNPFAETPDDDNLERVSASQDIPKPPRGVNEPQKSPMSRLSASSPQKEQSPTFQRQGMGRKIVRTSIRKDKFI
ncbi:rab11 family-interacting protein 1-like [Apostichopus japonicus]|uniref:rab11 family-interacting protein 1-like n=1 Tax=Stichopus japonicus TaxID=307972 RepID=UPI003AB6C9E8